jgi:hypothetical protein
MLQQNGKVTATDAPRALLDLFDNDVRGRYQTVGNVQQISHIDLADAMSAYGGASWRI